MLNGDTFSFYSHASYNHDLYNKNKLTQVDEDIPEENLNIENNLNKLGNYTNIKYTNK